MNLTKTIGIGTIIGLGLAALVFLLLLKFSSLIVLAVAVPKLTQGLTTDGGLNPWLAQALAVAFTACMVLGGYLIFGYIRPLTGKMIGLILLGCLLLAGYSLIIYKLQSSHAAVIQKTSANWNTNQLAKFSRATVDRNTSFFNPVNGEPLIWYFRDDTGHLEFFTSGGVHPQYNQPLAPIDAVTVKQFFTYLDTGRRDMIIGPEGPVAQVATVPPPAPQADKPPAAAKARTKTRSKAKTVEDTRPVHQVLRQQMSAELDHLVGFFCQAQNTR